MSVVVVYDPLDATVAGKVTGCYHSVNTPDYDGTTDKLVNPDLSALSAIDQKYWKHSSGTIVEMTATEKDDINGGLSGSKVEKIAAVDTKTDDLISAGFTYASKQFSLSLTAQLKMTGTHQVKDDPALTYPINWNTIDDLDVHALADSAALDAFYLTALGALRTHLDSGTALKDSVRAAADIAAVDAVTDSR